MERTNIIGNQAAIRKDEQKIFKRVGNIKCRKDSHVPLRDKIIYKDYIKLKVVENSEKLSKRIEN